MKAGLPRIGSWPPMPLWSGNIRSGCGPLPAVRTAVSWSLHNARVRPSTRFAGSVRRTIEAQPILRWPRFGNSISSKGSKTAGNRLVPTTPSAGNRWSTNWLSSVLFRLHSNRSRSTTTPGCRRRWEFPRWRSPGLLGISSTRFGFRLFYRQCRAPSRRRPSGGADPSGNSIPT